MDSNPSQPLHKNVIYSILSFYSDSFLSLSLVPLSYPLSQLFYFYDLSIVSFSLSCLYSVPLCCLFIAIYSSRSSPILWSPGLPNLIVVILIGLLWKPKEIIVEINIQEYNIEIIFLCLSLSHLSRHHCWNSWIHSSIWSRRNLSKRKSSLNKDFLSNTKSLFLEDHEGW